MEGAPDDGACKERCRSRIFIVRSFGGSARGSRSAWPQIAICPNSEAPAPRSLLRESRSPEDRRQLQAKSRTRRAARFLLRVRPAVRPREFEGHIRKETSALLA